MKSLFMLMTPLAMGQTVFRSDTRAVEVTVVARRADGSIVKDLRKDEIRVFDNNREQTIASFDRIGGESAVAAGAASTRSIRSERDSLAPRVGLEATTRWLCRARHNAEHF
jgi:hypothetical protein